MTKLREIVDHIMGQNSKVLEDYYRYIDFVAAKVMNYDSAKVAYLQYMIVNRIIRKAYLQG